VTALIGRTFLHPFFDYLLIGGGLSFVCTALVYQRQDPLIGWNPQVLPLLILLSNSAHFAASTVRLYTKPGTFQQHPYLTMAFPLASIVLLASCIALPLQLGVHLQALYLTWSPYHYAAQAYGLAIIYCVRSGYSLTAVERKIFRAICMLPFLLAFIGAPHAGLNWLAPSLHAVVPAMLRDVIISAVFLLPLAFFLYSYRRGPMPLIGLLAVLANGVWWVVLDYLSAFFWATIFHGLQYLVIAAIFHIRDQTALPENRRGPLYHAGRFYLLSLALGYGLFYCWPYAFVLTGFGLAESVLLVAAAINIHHFIVDARIWRLAPGDGNRAITAT
jgi:hypothetical protein